MNIILTVTGHDHQGIVAAVAAELAKNQVNILNISQTLMDDYFTMILHGRFDDETQSIQELQEAMRSVEEEQRLKIRIQSEAIFDAMHTL
ncbi:ACT domain-containing protein [Rothia sp. P6271]|uniref:ACT domain-containing protein n=1 Tax=unclassified Rothia (in: high G+C Gram-positive bacteria) TaxID=2689056 RepID=UPI003AC39B62